MKPICLSCLFLVSTLAGPVMASDPAVNTFTLDFYRHAGSTQPDNLVLSPYSIHTVMLMAMAGAEGETLSELTTGLRLVGDPATAHEHAERLRAALQQSAKSGEIEMQIAQSLWPDDALPLNDPFREILRTVYAAEAIPVNFRTDAAQARNRINAWVATRTRDKIPHLLPEGSLNAMTRLVLVNAIYFKGRWAHAFPAEATRSQPFHIDETTALEVPMMHQQQSFHYADLDSFSALALPYRQDTMEMLVLLPSPGSSLHELEATLSPARLAEVDQNLRRETVRVALPRFTARTQLECRTLLTEMGMPTSFQSGRADFSGISGQPGDLFISEVVHEAMIEVTEEGTEAAAATGAIMKATAFRPEQPVSFIADHPFLYLIRDRATGVILFIGRITNPTL